MQDRRTIAEALIAAAASGRGVRTVEHDGRTEWLPYDSLLTEALAIAGSLTAAGLPPGHRVGLVVPEVNAFIRGFFGISVAGLVPVPLFPPAQAGDVRTFVRQSQHILQASQASAVLATREVAPLLETAGLLPPIPVFVIDDLQPKPPLTSPAAIRSEDVALVQFTSGSTAAPKGVVLTHANISANIGAIAGADGLALTPSDIGVSWLPLYHDMGLIGMLLTAVFLGAEVTIMSPQLFLKRPTAWLEAISRYGATVSFAPNFAYDLCLRRVKPSQIEALDLSRWRVAGCGADPIRFSTLGHFAERFAAAGFTPRSFVASYGLAEHTVAVSLSPGGLRTDAVDRVQLLEHSRAVPAPGGSQVTYVVGCGRPFPGHRIRIVDSGGTVLPERYVGEIVAHGPSVMRGYFEHPDATAETLHDGWLHTGDLGYLAAGELFVCGRTKDLIVRQGRKYHPSDLESVIADLEDLKSSAVVVLGISRLEEADEVVAVIEARSANAAVMVDDVRRRLRETFGLELDRVIVTPLGTIPRTTSGKLKRAETRARVQDGTLLPAGRG